jgi:hypothetical protein
MSGNIPDVKQLLRGTLLIAGYDFVGCINGDDARGHN